MSDNEDESTLPTAHHQFALHFTDPLYESQGDEFGPFGSDEGWDLITDWRQRRTELEKSGSVAYILGDGDPANGLEMFQELNDSAPDEVDAAVLVISAGFTLLRLTGSIDPDGRRFVLLALDHLQRRYGPQPEFNRLRTDLIAFNS